MVLPDDVRWLAEIEAQVDGTVPYYVPQLIAEIRRLRAALARLQAAAPAAQEEEA